MRRNYTSEQKREMVSMYCEGISATDICLHTGVPRSTFYSWIKLYKFVKAESGSEVNANDYARQKQRIARLENMIEVLRNVNCCIESPLKVKLNELEKLYGKHSVHVLCGSLDVARGTFYNHVLRNKKDSSTYQARRSMLCKKIREVYDKSNQIYGARKIRAVLQTQGINTTDRMVTELMQSMNLKSIRGETKKLYRQNIYEGKKDVLKLDFSAKAPNQIWASDITYFKVCGTTKYICAIIDLYSRRVISYKISQRQSTQLTTTAFRTAYKERKPSKGLIFHSDRGMQYSSFTFRELLKSLSVKQSFSPTARPYHNAVMESFFASLKKEELYRINFKSIREFEQSVGTYIERFNNERPHVTLRYLTPDAYEQRYFKNKK